MSLKEKAEDMLVTDSENILESNLERVRNILQLHGDGTIDLDDNVLDSDGEIQILGYLIGQEFAEIIDRAEENHLETSFFYDRLEIAERTVRNRLKSLREDGLIKDKAQGKYQIVVENLPKALDRIEEEMEDE